jgi:uncharacterized ParB-like nuclease family protein
MAQSYGIPGKNCSVAEFEAMRLEGRIVSAWMGFCDCMFLQPVEMTTFRLDGTPYFECASSGGCHAVGANVIVQVMETLGRY